MLSGLEGGGEWLQQYPQHRWQGLWLTVITGAEDFSATEVSDTNDRNKEVSDIYGIKVHHSSLVLATFSDQS